MAVVEALSFVAIFVKKRAGELDTSPRPEEVAA
jgi:hypothetical protein